MATLYKVLNPGGHSWCPVASSELRRMVSREERALLVFHGVPRHLIRFAERGL
jgi:hypothetical protein